MDDYTIEDAGFVGSISNTSITFLIKCFSLRKLLPVVKSDDASKTIARSILSVIKQSEAVFVYSLVYIISS